ncbi:beta-ketoacyl-ACP synthase III [Rivibacter subsaxonicus]|uniref:Beta-ketodecanoyl-[acyl-carrier-protein] synthase n=1 Tax=Rivibacter subsaxonicus TaxID=457575 RepID=A0A4Q7W256_9BURK|nr:beta-ketoacyl-ACP synthase III [Rivibacter subsaxonicus]RZU02985.1 beta-ketodecanoyl-[acyl-carrier-protein] synthase [Rivibacter subsaxonicus]
MARAIIRATGLYTPPEIITNAELVVAFNAYAERINRERAAEIEAGTFTALTPSSEEFIEKASGIKQRFVLEKSGVLDPNRMYPRFKERADDELSIEAEIAVLAGRDALARADRDPKDVDGVICSSANMQRPYPAMAIEIQQALGTSGWGYDMNVACSSATFAIEAAANAVKSGSARSVLVISPEITSAHLEWRDRDCHFIFGDVATAVLVERVEDDEAFDGWEILGTRLITQFSNAIRNNFGFINRSEDSDPNARDKTFRQEGRKVFKEVCPMAAEHIEGHLKDLGFTPATVRRFWLHQANLNMNLLIARKLLGHDPSADEAPVILDQYANTASAGSIIAFHQHQADLKAGEVGVICSFGAGYSIGSVVVRRHAV